MISKAIIFILLAVFTGACAVNQVETELELPVAGTDGATYTLEDEVRVRTRSAADSVLRAGTTWMLVGTIGEGAVFRTEDQVVIVNSFNVHEADIVVRGGTLVGYYLPTERTFVHSNPVDIVLNPKEE